MSLSNVDYDIVTLSDLLIEEFKNLNTWYFLFICLQRPLINVQAYFSGPPRYWKRSPQQGMMFAHDLSFP